MNRRRAAILAAILLVLGGLAAFALTRPDSLKVPNVLERSSDEARLALEDRGFEVRALPRPACAERGTVTEQSPLAGEDADDGSTVTITVSTGQEVAVPDVSGLQVNRARSKLEREQLLVRSVRERFSSRAGPGRAVGTRPTRGTRVDCQSAVTLFASKGTNLVDLPDLIGRQQVEATATLERLGFIVDVDERNADQPEGEVIGQDPGPGSRLAKGDTVKIVVSTGAGSVIVPDVEGQTESSARSNLTFRGLSVIVDEQLTDDPSEDDRVIDQAPAGGTRVRSGDQVTIVVGVFEEPKEREEPPPDEEPEPEPEPGPKAARR